MAKLTVGDLREAMDGLPDDAMVFVNGNPDRAVDTAFAASQISPWSNEDWQKGDPTFVALELWLEGDDEFPYEHCRHAATTQTEDTSKGERA
jgi:hypothetical protein